MLNLAGMMGLWRPLQDYRDVNVTGTRNVCQAALNAGVGRIVHVSSWTVYGMNLGRPAREDFLLQPFREPYAISKAEGDLAVQRMIAEDQLPAVIIRPGTFFGPGDRLHFGRMADRVRAGKGVIVGRGDNALPFAYVTDVVQGLLLALDCRARSRPGLQHHQRRAADPAGVPRGDRPASIGVSPPTVHLPYHALYVGGDTAERLVLAHRLAAAAASSPGWASSSSAPTTGTRSTRPGATSATHRKSRSATVSAWPPRGTRRRTGSLSRTSIRCLSARLTRLDGDRSRLAAGRTSWSARRDHAGSALLLTGGGLLTGCAPPVDLRPHTTFRVTDYTRFVDNDQGAGQVFMRYPLGRIGLWSTPRG